MRASSVSDNESVVWAMWYAHKDRRVDLMLDVMHTDVVWEPWSPEDPREYRGHDGIRQMVKDLQATNGRYSVRLESVAETHPSFVVARGVVVASGQETLVEWRVALRDGLITRVTTVAVDAGAGDGSARP
jgi:ketosteroid isomerase-like protein